MPTPSLLIVPARFKSGKMYSQIPTSGNGDFTVTRATSATRVNASGYIEVVASGIPRLDYFASGGVVGCPALLVEPSAQNLALQSEGFEVSGNWAPVNVIVTTGTTVEFTAPDGTTSADLITTTSTIPSYVSQNITIASGTYTISVFAKAGNYGLFRIGNVSSASRAAWFNLNAGAVTGTVNGGTASMQNYGNGWYRCIYSSSGIVSGIPTVFFAPSNAPNDINAVSGSTIYFWGAQLETGSVATSYIPTTTGSVTRNADVISVSGAVSGSIGQTEGTVYAEFQSDAVLDEVFFVSRQSGAGSNRIAFTKDSANILKVVLVANNVGAVNFSGSVSGMLKMAFAYKTGSSALYVNGNFIASSTTTFTFSATGLTDVTINKSSILIGGSVLRPTMFRAIGLYTTRLTNDHLAELTA